MYKPTQGTTAYATFASSLEQGDIAPSGTVNANQALAPYRSNEWELGFKTEDKPLNISTAVFRLQRPFANTVPFGTANFTNTRYYSTIAPVDLTGVISNNNTAFTGAPRTISSSLEFSF
jgi:iron complex outermembrane receptor protein